MEKELLEDNPWYAGKVKDFIDGKVSITKDEAEEIWMDLETDIPYSDSWKTQFGPDEIPPDDDPYWEERDLQLKKLCIVINLFHKRARECGLINA